MKRRLGPLIPCGKCKEAKPATDDFFRWKKEDETWSSYCLSCIRERDNAPERVERRRLYARTIARKGPPLSPELRFWQKVDRNAPTVEHVPGISNCWLWTGAKTSKGYGHLQFEKVDKIATHVAWFLEKGSWPSQWLLHKCDNPSCIRVEHLFEGDGFDNARDCVAKGRHPMQWRNRVKRGLLA